MFTHYYQSCIVRLHVSFISSNTRCSCFLDPVTVSSCQWIVVCSVCAAANNFGWQHPMQTNIKHKWDFVHMASAADVQSLGHHLSNSMCLFCKRVVVWCNTWFSHTQSGPKLLATLAKQHLEPILKARKVIQFKIKFKCNIQCPITLSIGSRCYWSHAIKCTLWRVCYTLV